MSYRGPIQWTVVISIYWQKFARKYHHLNHGGPTSPSLGPTVVFLLDPGANKKKLLVGTIVES
jgi:hypothetical protein